MAAWAYQDVLELTCRQKWTETEESVSFELASKEESAFHFKPGQFATLGFELPEGVAFRAYSISSMPQQNFLRFTVKRVVGGKVSNHIVDALSVGDTVSVLQPQGAFNSVDCAPKRKVTLISAGCGVTPVMAMAQQWLRQGDIEIDFIHVAKSVSDTIYYAELQQLAQCYPQFHLKLLLKEATGSSHQQGRLSQAWLVRLCPDIAERSVYLCGPVGFMQDVKSYLQQLNFDMAHFFEESFTPSVYESEVSHHKQESSDQDEIEPQEVTVSTPAFASSVTVKKGSLLLDALEKGNVPMIAACRSGICGSCKCKVKVGMVERLSTETLSAQEIEQGYALACSSRLVSDVEVSLN